MAARWYWRRCGDSSEYMAGVPIARALSACLFGLSRARIRKVD